MSNNCTENSIRAKRRVLIEQSSIVTGLDYALFIPANAANPMAGGTLMLYFLNANLPDLTLQQIQLLMQDGVTPAPWLIASINSVTNVANALSITLQPGNLVGTNIAQSYLVKITSAANVDMFFAQAGFILGSGYVTANDCQSSLINQENNTHNLTIDYLSKDYNSLRQLMLNRLSITMPDWQQDSPADTGIMLVELLAYAADQLSYYQDAAATEAYLNTARSRISVRRHARLLNYQVHEGCNARTWVKFDFIGADSEQNILQRGIPLLTQVTSTPEITAADYSQALASQPIVFETITPVTLYQAHNQIEFYTWGADNYVLPKDTTTATLDGDYTNTLKVGDILLFTEVVGINTGLTEDADPNHRCAVYLTGINLAQDALFNNRKVTQITWASTDALPFCLTVKIPGITNSVAVACGNIALADHGQTISGSRSDINFVDLLPNQVPAEGIYNPVLTQSGLTFATPLPAVITSAQQIVRQDPCQALPKIFLKASDSINPTWTPQLDLLSSAASAPNFVIEMENDRTAHLRFGDNIYGKQPIPGTIFSAYYRIGNGKPGNIGANSLFHWVSSDNLSPEQVVLLSHVKAVTNPLPATGGVDPETISQVCMNAPQTFRQQPRYVTLQDYAAAALRYPGVSQATAVYEWTGSWNTVVLSIVRTNQQPVDLSFQQSLTEFLNQQRLMGYDIQIKDPVYVPLDIALVIQVSPGYDGMQVYQALRAHFSQQDGTKFRFFNSAKFTLGQAIYLSTVVAEVMTVEGVAGVDLNYKNPSTNEKTRFKRYFAPSTSQTLVTDVIQLASFEFPQLNNNPDIPANGQIRFIIEGVSQ